MVFGLGREFYINAWRQLKHGTSNMDTLVAVSTGIAYTFSVFNLLFPVFGCQEGLNRIFILKRQVLSLHLSYWDDYSKSVRSRR